MNYEFKGKRAIVTGASSGIGKGIAMRFAKMGVKVILAARRQLELEEVAAEIRSHGGTAIVTPCDVTNPEDVARVVQTAVDEL